MDARSAVPVVLSKDATSPERIAARDLAAMLGTIYPANSFPIVREIPASGRYIALGTARTLPTQLLKIIGVEKLKTPESFAVKAMSDGKRRIGVIAGADPRGVAYGVYALLEKLGCGFYLSYDALPSPAKRPFTFEGWQLADQPLVRDRLVFDWHNFLSGCSTWNLPDWQKWIAQSQKMGYNAVMVHAYGNNPMVSFTFNGKTKPVGYLSTTVKGRDWSTMHVNDVWRLYGGEVFNQRVFGADAAMAPEEDRAAAAQKLMHDVFASAAERGMEVYLAVDQDTLSANPQTIIETLPREARFFAGADKAWLVNPETPEGYQYYKAQVKSLMDAYPQVTCLVLWWRIHNLNTPWLKLKLSEMPKAWQQEYAAEIGRTPEIADDANAPRIFALGKIVRAFDRALKELGHERVQLACGTWKFAFLAPCDRFFPPHVKLIGLDYNVIDGHSQLRDAASRKVIRDVAKHREVIPVIWAQHDDGKYLGRPFTPFEDFSSKLKDAQAAGFGIIHWTTRPLDIFFKSHARQVWQSTKDESFRATCDAMAAKSFGAAAHEAMGNYLERWIAEAPQYARETSDYFIDRPLLNVDRVVAQCGERRQIIAAVDRAGLTPEQRDRLDYFKGLEEFIAASYRAQDALSRAQSLQKKGDLQGARAALSQAHPEAVIEQFAKFSSLGGMTRGEQGLVVTMNTRWLPHFVSLRQALGMEAVRYNLAPTSHDTLAQSPGPYTFHFGADRQLWQTLGTAETEAETFVLPPGTPIKRDGGISDNFEEICHAGIESGKPVALWLGPICSAINRDKLQAKGINVNEYREGSGSKSQLPAGRYRITLLFLDPTSTAPGQRVFNVSINGGATPQASANLESIDIFKQTGQAGRVLPLSRMLTLPHPGAFTVTLAPVHGKAILSGIVIDPVYSAKTS